MNIKTQVIVGMSGGVDSSVAAFLLKQQGYQVSGLFMKNWEEDDGSEYCTAKQDLADAQQVCDRLNIKLYEANFANEYWDNVFEAFIAEYKQGRTPNPDVLCNREIKFNVFLDYARLLGAERIATGHYARLERNNTRQLKLLKATDGNKDQSYFLQSVSADQFQDCLFPLGSLDKNEVRNIARDQGFENYRKKDSTGICFIGERRFSDFLKTYLAQDPGLVRSVEGVALGHHQGLMYHTIGQRQGLGIGGIKGQQELPWYVVEKDLSNNELIVAQGNDNPALFSSSMTVTNLHWINSKPDLSAGLAVKVRYRQADQACVVVTRGNQLEVSFSLSQRAITPGQWACFYRGDHCLGGGIISTVRKNL